MQVLDKGRVELIGSMGGDLSVVAAARVSNGAEYEGASKGQESDYKLIQYLIKHRHGTPFEHALFTFYIKCPLFVRSEWHRHRMASYNEISGRYVTYEPEFYIPEVWRVPAETNKQGSVVPDDGIVEINTAPTADTMGMTVAYTREDWHQQLTLWFTEETQRAYTTYEHMIKWGVAKEMARMVLPPNLYTQFYFTVNARSLMNFLSLRNAPDAQYEIQQYGEAVESIFCGLMPLTYNAWLKNGRVAP